MGYGSKVRGPIAMTSNKMVWLFCGFLLAVGVGFEFQGDAGRQLLRYQSDFHVNHEYWRLMTAHLVHLGWSHFIVNALALVLIFLMYADCFTVKIWLASFLVLCFGVSLSLMVFYPELQWYLGMSGVLHGLLASALGFSLLKRIYKFTSEFGVEDFVLFTGLVGKLVYEQIIGSLPFTQSASGGSVVINAHLYGAITGCIWALFLFKFTHSNK
ncbi:MAG: rhombosortase [Gammaproteobacteria bacterium]|nr:rhombosortase [Gammaproteobacteria bacterium]NNC97370.1 rhombosortase [Gammaproteobacteria bacterium]NNM13111.1 rhombosortase [Gammaproteobacteria bacterium]